MTDTLILFKPLAEFGEALKKECPNNDCVIYRNVYERYCEEYADYNRIKEAFADLSEATVRALEHAIRTSEKELYAMWFENYAVLKQRAALGMAYGNAKPKRAINNPDGSVRITQTIKVTGKGIVYFVNKFIGGMDGGKLNRA